MGLIIQEIKFLVGFSRVYPHISRVCPHFHMFAHVFLHFYWVRVARVKNISPRVTSGSPKRDLVRFGFLKTQELRVKCRVGFGPDPFLNSTCLIQENIKAWRNYSPLITASILETIELVEKDEAWNFRANAQCEKWWAHANIAESDMRKKMDFL